MKFFKRNPSINFIPTVCGYFMNESMVVCGDEFEPFADPGTFPGWTPSLVEISFDAMSDPEKDSAKKVAFDIASRPPRHLSMTSSSSIGTIKPIDETVKVVTPTVQIGNVSIATGNKGQFVVESSHVDGVDAKPIVDPVMEAVTKIPPLSKMYTRESLISTFSGITEKNADAVMGKIGTIKDLAEASNTLLRSVGVSANKVNSIRGTARSEMGRLGL